MSNGKTVIGLRGISKEKERDPNGNNIPAFYRKPEESHKELFGMLRNLKGNTPKYEILCGLIDKVGVFVLPACGGQSLSDWGLTFRNKVVSHLQGSSVQ